MEDVSKEFEGHPIVSEIVAFIREGGKRSICMPHSEA
jgi:UDP-N-acetylglucosamine acyltransferase